MVPSSNGQDRCFSDIKSEFNSPWDYMTKYEFIKSSECSGGNCVEVNITDHTVTVRDAEGDLTIFTHREWQDFVAGVKNGEFDI